MRSGKSPPIDHPTLPSSPLPPEMLSACGQKSLPRTSLGKALSLLRSVPRGLPSSLAVLLAPSAPAPTRLRHSLHCPLYWSQLLTHLFLRLDGKFTEGRDRPRSQLHTWRLKPGAQEAERGTMRMGLHRISNKAHRQGSPRKVRHPCGPGFSQNNALNTFHKPTTPRSCLQADSCPRIPGSQTQRTLYHGPRETDAHWRAPRLNF